MAAKADSTTPVQGDTAKQDRAKAIDKAKYDATRAVVEANKDDWNAQVVANCAAVGIEWTPPLTAEQRAQQEFDRLLAEHPSLAQRVTPTA